ncbi:solute carrier family 22 member 5-like [Haliotis rubra]|uniref:solute carrier family 22 member 5-like n=1 Tax=Haliotis rubra TaxID=36100 RepID=UPI001EE5E8F4|nr:solute carrier family 22 member 5-like [Haliotis rubra]
MHLESLIEELGTFGPYQRCIHCILVLLKALSVPPMMMMAFAGVEPDWWCESRGQDETAIFTNNSYQNCQWNGTCQRIFEPETVTIVSEWNLVCSKTWVSNTIISIQMVGVLFGSIIAGYCSDRYGRKKVVYGGLLLSTISNLIASFSLSWIMFAVFRVLIGLGIGMTLSCSFLYRLEFVGKKWRGACTAIPSWSLGVVLFAILCWFIRNWKWLHVTIVAINIPLLLTWFVMPESLRWLVAKGHLEEARRTVTRIAKFNKKPVPNMSILELIAEEERAERKKAKSYSYIDLVTTRTLRSKTLITSFLWMSISIVYYAITFGIKNLSGDFYLNLLIMGLLEVPMSFVELFMVSVFSRRWACAILLMFSAVACFGVAIVTKLAPAHIKVPLENGFAISAKLSTISAWVLTAAMTSEQFPTVIRNLAYAAQNTAARFGGIVGAQLVSLGSKDDLMPPFLAMGILMSFTALSCFGLEETSKTALEDTMKKYTREGVNEEVEGSLPLNDITLTMNDISKGDIAEMDEYCTYAKSCGGTEEGGSICQSKVKTIMGLVDNSKPEKNEGEEQRSSNTFLKSEHDT